MKHILLSLLLLTPTAWGALQLNEIRLDQPGSDTDEYFEIFSSDPAHDSLADVVLLVIGDGAGGSGVIENVTDLSSGTLSSPYFVGAESTFTLGTADLTTSLNFENSDNVTYVLARGFTGANGDDLDLDDDGTLDVTPWSSLLDAVAFLESDTQPPTNTEWAYVDLGGSVGPDGSYVPGHAYRDSVTGEWQIGQYDPAAGDDTPGAANPTSVPEPSSHALLLLGLGVLLWRRSRR